MLFDFNLIIPAGTPQDTPTVTLAKLTRSKLTQIRMLFPPGPATLAHVVIRHNLYQLMPANPEGTINFDDAIIISNLDYDLVDVPYELQMIGWSPLAVYEHTITIQFDLQPITGDTWDNFNDLLQQINSDRVRRF